jgi:hypothetical protein
MTRITIHILNAQKKLTAHAEWLRLPCQYLRKSQRLMPLPALDVVVKAGKFVIPEKGMPVSVLEAGMTYPQY